MFMGARGRLSARLTGGAIAWALGFGGVHYGHRAYKVLGQGRDGCTCAPIQLSGLYFNLRDLYPEGRDLALSTTDLVRMHRHIEAEKPDIVAIAGLPEVANRNDVLKGHDGLIQAVLMLDNYQLFESNDGVGRMIAFRPPSKSWAIGKWDESRFSPQTESIAVEIGYWPTCRKCNQHIVSPKTPVSLAFVLFATPTDHTCTWPWEQLRIDWEKWAVKEAPPWWRGAVLVGDFGDPGSTQEPKAEKGHGPRGVRTVGVAAAGPQVGRLRIIDLPARSEEGESQSQLVSKVVPEISNHWPDYTPVHFKINVCNDVPAVTDVCLSHGNKCSPAVQVDGGHHDQHLKGLLQGWDRRYL